MSFFDHVDEDKEIEPDIANLSLYFAKIITSKHNQHALIRITGKAGTGKSWAGLSLARGVAIEVARILGGNPEDYFTMHNDLGVISKQEIKRVMTNPKPHTVKFLDDVAVAWNARKYNNEFNIDLNDLIQTFRPNHNLVIMTLQSGFLIDKVPRSLVHFQIEMDTPLYDQGINIAKVFSLELNEDSGKVYRHYLRAAGCTYKRHVFEAPPKEITQAYEIERAIQLKRMSDIKENERTTEYKTIKKKDYCVGFVDMLCSEFGLSVNAACNKAGISRTYYDKLTA